MDLHLTICDIIHKRCTSFGLFTGAGAWLKCLDRADLSWNENPPSDFGSSRRKMSGVFFFLKKKTPPATPKKKWMSSKSVFQKTLVGCFGDRRNICLLQNFLSQCRIKNTICCTKIEHPAEARKSPTKMSTQQNRKHLVTSLEAIKKKKKNIYLWVFDLYT